MSTHRRTGAVTRLLLAALRSRPATSRELCEHTGLDVHAVSRTLGHLRARGAVASRRVPGAVGGALLWSKRREGAEPCWVDARAVLARLEGGPTTTTALAAGDERLQQTVRRQLLTCEALGWVDADRSRKPHRWTLTDAGRRAVRAWRRDEADIADARRPRR